MADHDFWFVVTIGCVAWYSSVTIYVAIRGVFDIRAMLDRLRDRSHS
jgi:hypothetical protein